MTAKREPSPGGARAPALWLAGFFIVLGWSVYHPKDLLTWFLEVFPALIGLALLVSTRRRFPLSPLLYGLILVHAWILMVGGHYTYAEVPLFDALKSVFGWQRNNYDKLGHFVQGFEPAILTREILLRRQAVRGKRWLGFLTVSVCLAFSACYELLEWRVAVAEGSSADAFLGTQGDMWDTQSDMAWALFGAVAALITLSGAHDRQLRRFMPRDGIQSREASAESA